MRDDHAPSYRHTQRGPWHLLLLGIGAVLLVVAAITSGPEPPRWALAAPGAVFLLTAGSFRQLTAEDRGDHLLIRFGPLPTFRRRIFYADLRSAEVGRTLLSDGWGIHLSLRGGWVWNIWGRECVVMRLRRGTLRFGTDDAEGLAAFLNARIAAAPRP